MLKFEASNKIPQPLDWGVCHLIYIFLFVNLSKQAQENYFSLKKRENELIEILKLMN